MAEFQRCRIPELLTLLRKNSIADPEKLLLELVEDKIKQILHVAKEQLSDEYNGPKLNKVSIKNV